MYTVNRTAVLCHDTPSVFLNLGILSFQTPHMRDEMTEVERIEDQLRRAIGGDAWHGPSVKEVLANVTAQQATAKPVQGAHSIWELLFHMGAWEGVALRRLNGDKTPLPDDKNWPLDNPSGDAEWNAAWTDFDNQNQQLRKAILRLTDDQLEDQTPGTDHSFYHLLHGVVQHDLYHAGQIVLLKRAMQT